MDTLIRKGTSPFYGEECYAHGLSRSGNFNKRESDELMEYGHTFSGLSKGTIEPINEEEIRFVADMLTTDESSLYTVRLWKKYIQSIEKSKIHHGFAKNASHKSNELMFA